jgi:hypothetical protein
MSGFNAASTKRLNAGYGHPNLCYRRKFSCPLVDSSPPSAYGRSRQFSAPADRPRGKRCGSLSFASSRWPIRRPTRYVKIWRANSPPGTRHPVIISSP